MCHSSQLSLILSSQIARINGSSLTDDSIVIIGAHQDSINMWPFSPAPGSYLLASSQVLQTLVQELMMTALALLPSLSHIERFWLLALPQRDQSSSTGILPK